MSRSQNNNGNDTTGNASHQRGFTAFGGRGTTVGGG
jgi:hypothetical protein